MELTHISSLESLETHCQSCQNCPLGAGRKNIVFGMGNPQSGVLFIGEAPGAVEDETGLPFQGRSGKLLDSMLAEVGLSRDDIYIANMAKCRPPENRDPSAKEKKACAPLLEAQIRLLNPKIMVFLGRVSATAFLGKDFKVTKDHGKFFPKEGIEMMSMYHPAMILRDPRKKPEAREDFLILKEKILEIKGA